MLLLFSRRVQALFRRVISISGSRASYAIAGSRSSYSIAGSRASYHIEGS